MKLTLKNFINLDQCETQIVLIRKYNFCYSLYYYINHKKMRNICNALCIIVSVMLRKSNVIIDAFMQLWPYSVSAVDCNLQQADIKNNMGHRMTKKGYAAFVHTIWNVQVLCLRTLMLICYAVWIGLPLCV
jgi:hypothetical protein